MQLFTVYIDIVISIQVFLSHAAWSSVDPFAAEGRSLCDAARAHADREGEKVRKIIAPVGDGRKRLKSLKRYVAKHPGFLKPRLKRLWQQNSPTLVVNMTLPNIIRVQGSHEIMIVRNISRKLMEILDAEASTGFSEMSLEFEKSVLFVPSCVEFMHVNRALVKEVFPQVHTCHCNAFMADKMDSVFGLHSAGDFSMENDRGWLFPEFHLSFHTALTSTNISSNPFSIFESTVPEIPNWDFFVENLLAMELPEHRRELVAPALAMLLLEHPRAAPHVAAIQTMKYYLMSTCYELKHCGAGVDEEDKHVGTYWNLQPGQALHFNNRRLHSDSGFGSDAHVRLTMDLRCFSKQYIPPPYIKSLDLVTELIGINKIVAMEMFLECAVRLFNYSSAGEFMETVFGTPQMFPMIWAVGNIGMSLVNQGEDGLMHEHNLEGMRRHGERVRRAYETGGINFNAFESCYGSLGDVEQRISAMPWHKELDRITKAISVDEL